MDNNSYTGNMYFVGTTEDILGFENFRFDEAHQIIEFDFSCDESNSGSYGHEDIATSANGYLYATKNLVRTTILKGKFISNSTQGYFGFCAPIKVNNFCT